MHTIFLFIFIKLTVIIKNCFSDDCEFIFWSYLTFTFDDSFKTELIGKPNPPSCPKSVGGAEISKIPAFYSSQISAD